MSAISRLLQGKPQVLCERIICLYHSRETPRWWQLLEEDDRLLFAPRGRIVEASITDVAESAQEAVCNGYRPVFFLSDPVDWPKVLEAMSHYRSLGSLYILGRDDTLMRELLHGPSVEILEVYAGEGTVLVPDLSYGKALDGQLALDLADFARDTAGDLEDEWHPRFSLVSRLNAFRRIELAVNCRSGQVTLTQFYDTESEPSARPLGAEPCSLPLSFLDGQLEFDEGSCVLDGTQGTVIDQILNRFNISLPQWGLLPPSNILTRLKRAGIEVETRGRALALRMNQAALDLLWEIFDPGAVHVRGEDDDLAAEVEGALEGHIPVVASRLQSAADGAWLLHVQWVAMSPAQAPVVEVEIGGIQTVAAWEHWAADDLPKTLRIETTESTAGFEKESERAVVLTWEESQNLLRVWIEREAHNQSP